MIKLFRNIRKNLLIEGKTSKYFKYAIGEIILVVIGILIALSINNWNQHRLEKAKESTYLSNIKRDLKNQLDSIDVHLGYEKNFIHNAGRVLTSFYKTDRLAIDSLLMINLSELTSRKTFVSMDPTYTDLISSGNIDLIQNNDFKNKLIIYYQDLERIEKVIQNNNSLLTDQNYNPKIFGLIYFNKVNQPYSHRLESISKRILEKEENELILLNLTRFRESIAYAHTELLKDLKIKTQELISILNNTK